MNRVQMELLDNDRHIAVREIKSFSKCAKSILYLVPRSRIIAFCYLRRQRDRWTLEGNLHEMGPRGNSAGRSNEIAYRSRNNPFFIRSAHDIFCMVQ